MGKVKSKYYDGMSVKQEEIARSNRFANICHTVEASIIAVAYILEFVKGARTLPYVIITLVLALIPPILEFIFLAKNKCSPAIKHIVSFGFGIFYTFICLTTNNKLAFIYVIPMLIVVTAFNDARYCALVSSAAFIVNIIQVVVFFVQGYYTMADSATVEIQVLAFLIIVFYVSFASRILRKNSDIKMDQIEKHSDETTGLLDNILKVTTAMVSNIEQTSEKIEELSDKVNSTKDAMAEVNAGSADTAEAVQNQLEFTEDIQNKVEAVDANAKSIAESIEQARVAVNEGSQNVEGLVSQVNASVENGKLVTEQLEVLNQSMEEMKSVIEIIENIASQTGLLALNASIEAARAGEAGRGFAVVASEISKMSGETEDATDTIKKMIKNITKTIEKVVEVTSSMVEKIEGQTEATTATAQSFNEIEESTKIIIEQSENLQGYIEELASANREIVDSISTISAITEEVSAHASSTFAISEQNATTVKDVVTLTEQLKGLANELKQN